MNEIESYNEMILIVEDDLKNQKILQTLCKKIGYDCDVAENGKVALDQVKQNDYFLYIVDLMMPVMDGKTFISELKKIEEDPVILVQSALDSTDTIIEIMKLGVFDYIIKPIDISLFQKTFNKAVEYKRLKVNEVNQLKNFREEMALVREIQASLRPNFSDLKGFDIAYAILPAEELSGDFLDSFIAKDMHQIVLCDVSGHGIASSYIGTEIKRIFRMLSANGSKPSTIIKGVNETITEDLKNSRYLSTVAICRIDQESESITYAAGGHPPSFYYSSDKGLCDPVHPKGPIVGFVPDVEYEDITIEMKKDDCLLLYTDGITEAFSEDGSTMYDEERLIDIYVENADKSALDIIYSILDSVYQFSNFSKQHDDITLVCIKKR